MLIENLPPSCALVRASTGHAWTSTNYQLANVQDGLEALRLQVAASAGAKNVPKLKPVPRPDTKDQQQGNAQDPEQVRAMLDSLKPPKLELVKDD